MTLSQITPQVNPPSLIPDYVEIPLTRGKVALVSIEDAPRVMEHKWMASQIRGVWYATRGKKQPNGRQSCEFMHRYILDARPGQHVDHADGSSSTLDNRRTNIRLATPSQNGANKALSARNTSGYVGVRKTSHGTYSAAINHLDKYISLGAFPDAITAAKVRDQKAFEIWGEFAVLNFPLEAQPLPIAA